MVNRGTRNAKYATVKSKTKRERRLTSSATWRLRMKTSETKHTKITLELSVCARVHVCVGDLLSVDRVLNINKTTISLTSVTNVDLWLH